MIVNKITKLIVCLPMTLFALPTLILLSVLGVEDVFKKYYELVDEFIWY